VCGFESRLAHVSDDVDDFSYPTPLDVASWRREVHTIYAAVRAEPDPAIAHALWVDARTHLFDTHPASPRRPGLELRHAPYNPAYRFTVPIRPAELHRWEFTSGTDGVVPFAGIGTVQLGDLGEVAVWWLDSYGGGVFLPLRDGSAGQDTYGAGRYVLDTVKGADLGRDGEQRWVVDLNFAYNPSCVYDDRWVCPLAPPANRIDAAAAVGELLPRGYA
jgi:uncharacterized protein (DUF1684 family)